VQGVAGFSARLPWSAPGNPAMTSAPAAGPCRSVAGALPQWGRNRGGCGRARKRLAGGRAATEREGIRC
jgi:hypothetical protein